MSLREILGLKKKSPRKLKSLCLIFPESHGNLCDFVAEHIHRSFFLPCISIKYSRINKEDIAKIGGKLNPSCILAVGYLGKLLPEGFYKLGMAHVHKGIVILINLSPSDEILDKISKGESIDRDIPKFVRYHYYICFSSKSSEEFIRTMEELLSMIIGNDLDKILYRKALEVCESLEGISGRVIEKRTEAEFICKLKDEVQKSKYIYNQQLLYSLYEDDDESLQAKLLYLIARRESQVIDSLDTANLTRDMKSERISQVFNYYNNYIDGDQFINQYGAGDNVAGDRIQGNKSVGGNG